jgi:hypothetical protein
MGKITAMDSRQALRIATNRPRPANAPLVLDRYLSSISSQSWLWLLAILTVNLLLAGTIVILDTRFGIDYWNLVRDTNAIARQPPYFGFYSNLGVLLWAIAASISLFTWAILSRFGTAGRESTVLLLGGLFALLAGLDDLFMLHESSHLIGISEKIVLAGYALFLSAFAIAALPIAHRTQWILLAAALAFFAASTAVDVLDLPIAGSVLIEEVFKFGGVAFLAAYLVALSFSTLAERRPDRLG